MSRGEPAVQPASAEVTGDRRDAAVPGTGRWPGGPAQERELVARLSGALEALAAGVVVCDQGGVEVYRNRAARSSEVRLGDVLAERAVSELLEAARRGVPGERRLELFAPVHRDLTVRACPISSEGRLLGAVAVVEDVSDRRRLDAIRRDFVANVSHELKTPVGALSLLAETLDGEDDPEVVARLSTRIAAEAERLGHIIDDLLDLSRIEANERSATESVPVRCLVQEAVDAVMPAAASRDIDVQLGQVPDDLGVDGDRRDLVSAVSNLVDNAVKYSEPGSGVLVSVVSEAGTVRIDVADRGIGIPARDRERIFERFYRVDRARSRRTGGTGLGLSIVRHVASNHGGEVRVQSEEGEGSTFSFLLPASRAGSRRSDLGPEDRSDLGQGDRAEPGPGSPAGAAGDG